MNRLLLTCTPVIATFALTVQAQTAPAIPYDHVHLSASDPDKASAWYAANLNGQQGENAGRTIFEPFTGTRPLPVELIWIKAAGAPSSESSAIDSIGFSVPDPDAKAKALVAAGATVKAKGVVVDPDGVTIELVNDPKQRGLHHVTLRTPDPKATLDWFSANFGGARVKMNGRDALQYGHTYLEALQGAGAAPSQGRAIDHLGFAPSNIDRTVADLRAHGGKITAEPSSKPNQFGHRTGYVEAPGGIRIELVEHTNCAWGKVPEGVTHE
jgi:catechol 2,3-dioxygenase-like lactoylglutathione lyase family enzyme